MRQRTRFGGDNYEQITWNILGIVFLVTEYVRVTMATVYLERQNALCFKKTARSHAHNRKNARFWNDQRMIQLNVFNFS